MCIHYYEFPEPAWYSAYAHLQMMKIDKTCPSIEVYANDPESCTSGNEWLNGIYIPAK